MRREETTAGVIVTLTRLDGWRLRVAAALIALLAYGVSSAGWQAARRPSS